MADGNPAPAKRRNDRDLTKDNYDDESEAMEEPLGGWKKADEETLKRRKIVKVKRPGDQPTVQPTAAANPFAGVSLFPPSDSGPNNGEVPKERTGSTTQLPSTVPSELATAPGEQQDKAPPAASPEVDVQTTAQAATASEETRGGESTPAVPAATAAPLFSSFATSTTSPFSLLGTGAKPFGSAASYTGAVTGFGGLVAAGGAAGFGAAGAAGSAPAFSFAASSSGGFSFPPISMPSIPSSGASGLIGSTGAAGAFGGVLFGSSGGSTAASMRMPAEKTVTGEEDETTMFSADGILFEYDNATKGWRERGRGETRLNEKRGGPARLLMRQKGNFKLILNALIYPQMAITPMSGGGITFSCMNAAASNDTPDKAPPPAKASEAAEAAPAPAPPQEPHAAAPEAAVVAADTPKQGSGEVDADAPKGDADAAPAAGSTESAVQSPVASAKPSAAAAASSSSRLLTYALRIKAPEKLQQLKDLLEQIKRDGARAAPGPDSFV